MQTEGTASWRLFSGINFSGMQQDISSGYDGKPNFTLKSVKKIN